VKFLLGGVHGGWGEIFNLGGGWGEIFKINHPPLPRSIFLLPQILFETPPYFFC
jgi:hypothetical protein